MKSWLENQHTRLMDWCETNVDALEWFGVVLIAACAGALLMYTMVSWP